MDLCNCPNTGALTEIPDSDCPFDLKQIQKIGFQKPGYVWDTAGTPATDIKTKADWDALIAATDDSKIVITPFLRDVKIEPGDFITTGGGDNTTLNGVEEIEGFNSTLVTAIAKSISPEQEKALKKLMCTSVVVYFFNGEGDIIAEGTTVATQAKGFNIQSLGVKDRRNEGFGVKDTVDIQFSIAPRWSEDLIKVSPTDFNPLYDL